MSSHQLAAVEATLTKSLIAWSAASVVLGTALAVKGHVSDDRRVKDFGRQTAAWGAVDAAIAGFGLLSQRRRGVQTAEQVQGQIRKLRNLLVINSVADIGYIASGAAVVGRNSKGKSALRMSAGDGMAIIVQGAFLLVLDVSQAVRLKEPSKIVA